MQQVEALVLLPYHRPCVGSFNPPSTTILLLMMIVLDDEILTLSHLTYLFYPQMHPF